jgi:hypothetical protein
MQEGLAQERYENDITGLRTPEAETKFIVSMGAPRRSFDFAVFPIDDYPDSELAAYAVQNPDLFLITHLSKITITSNERDARQILASVRDGTSTFEDAAKTHSKDAYAEKGGDMGVRPANELSIEISDAADMKSLIDLEAGELSELVKVPAGWAFFRAEDEPRVSDAGDSAVLQKIRSYVWQYERGRMEDWALGKAEAFLGRAAAEGFEEALDAEGIEKKQAGPLPINYGGVELFSSISSFPVEGLEEAASNENFWRLAFFTPLNTPSAPIVLGRYIFIIYPTEELGADESTAGYIESYANYFLSLCTGRSIRSFFLNSDKLEDRFQDAFLRHFLTSN